jgi:hypothetical protein
MYSDMLLQVALLRKGFSTVGAPVWFFTSVDSDMDFEQLPNHKDLFTPGALKQCLWTPKR